MKVHFGPDLHAQVKQALYYATFMVKDLEHDMYT